MNTKPKTKTRVVLGILAGARSISVRTDAKTGKTSRREILSNWHCEVYFVNATGETIKHCPLAHFVRSIDVPTGTRDNMIIWTLETARKLNYGVKSYIMRDYNECREKIAGKMSKRLNRLEKTVENGRDAFLARAKDSAEAAWDNLPSAIEMLKSEIADFGKSSV